MKIKFYAVLFFNLSVAVSLFSQQGRLDEEFGVNGIVKHSFDTTFLSYNEAHILVIQPDGKIVVGGRSAQRMVIARFEADGKLDESFGNAGAVFIEYAWLAWDRIKDLAIQPDGKILALVESYRLDPDLPEEWGNAYLMRFTTNGEFDGTFGHATPYGNIGAAKAETGYDVTNVGKMALLPDGTILVTGLMKNEFYNFRHLFIAKFDSSGNLDTGFANDGFAMFELNENAGEIINLLFQPDGKIILAGNGSTFINTTQFNLFVVRFMPNGSLDISFGTGGKFATYLPTQYALVRQFTMQDDGSIMTWMNKGAYEATKLDIVKIHKDGGLDSSFGVNGVLTLNTDTIIPVVKKILTDEDGNYYLAGSKFNGS